LSAPFLIAFGLDDSFLVARAKDNANFIKGSLKAIELLCDHYTVNIISTSYQQYVHYTTFLAGIPHNNTYCTSFPIADSILSMGSIEIDSEDEIEENTVECIRQMNHFFWELLINTGFSRVMQEVKPVGGVRKFEAVAQALEQEGLELNRSATIGDSITDWNMLKKTREAGGLALSFNGNEYAVSNCNVAVMSENCMITALLVDVFERGGLAAVEALVSDWGWSAIKALNRQGAIEESIYNAFRQAFSGSVFPHAVWVIQDNIEETIEVSKRYRRSIRGTQIGVLGVKFNNKICKCIRKANNQFNSETTISASI